MIDHLKKDMNLDVILATIVSVILTIISYQVSSYFNTITVVPIEVLGVFLNFLCVYLTVKENNWAWIFGILGTIVLGIFFYDLGLYSSMILSLGFFLPIQFYGLWNWIHGNNGGILKIEKYIDSINKNRLIWIGTISTALFFPYMLVMVSFSARTKDAENITILVKLKNNFLKTSKIEIDSLGRIAQTLDEIKNR
jgi:nicotinamide riboside transporter PnuC